MKDIPHQLDSVSLATRVVRNAQEQVITNVPHVGKAFTLIAVYAHAVH
jgi:hypothetical protein